MGPNILSRNVHTCLRHRKDPGFIVSFCPGLVPGPGVMISKIPVSASPSFADGDKYLQRLAM